MLRGGQSHKERRQRLDRPPCGATDSCDESGYSRASSHGARRCPRRYPCIGLPDRGARGPGRRRRRNFERGLFRWLGERSLTGHTIDLMRADRLLSVLLLLQVHRRITARELAKRLEVSERTIHRDMEALSTAGVPVVAERGTGGGWGLLEAYQTNLTGLNEVEIQALFLTRPARLL